MKKTRKPSAAVTTIFQGCVSFLEWLAAVLGTDYMTINVVVFCIVWPLVTVIETGLLLWILLT